MNKTVLVTGGSKGIGSAIAKLFIKSGYNVVLNYLNSKNEALALSSELNKYGECMIFKADVSKKDEVGAMIDAAVLRFGKIDVLVNNAGISQQKLFTDIGEDEWDQMMNVHVKGTYNCSQAVLLDMLKRKEGKIINISSIWGMVGASCEVHYSTAKAAIIGFTKALAKEMGPSNIQVNCVAPGVIETGMNEFLDESSKNSLIGDTPLMRFGKPEEIAHAVLFLSSKEADFITGQVFSPNGGFVV